MNVRIDAPGGQDQPFTGDHFGRNADDHAGRDAGHHIRIARFANSGNEPILDADVGLINSRVIDDQRIGDNAVERVGLSDSRRLPHSLPNRFSPAELTLVAVHREVILDLQYEGCVAQAQFIAGRWAIDVGVGVTGNCVGHSRPWVNGLLRSTLLTRRWRGGNWLQWMTGVLSPAPTHRSSLPNPSANTRSTAAARPSSLTGPFARLLPPRIT